MVAQADGAVRPALESGAPPDAAATAAFVHQCFPRDDYRADGSGTLVGHLPQRAAAWWRAAGQGCV